MNNTSIIEDVTLQVDTKYFRDFRPHVEKVKYTHPIFDTLKDYPKTNKDYENCQAAANNISRQLLLFPEEGDPFLSIDYYNLPEYSGLRPLEIELEILRDHMRDRWATETKFGLLPYIHGLRAIKMMFSETDITPSLADVTYLSMGMFQHRRKYLNLVGSMDAGKSSSTARLAWLYAAIEPKKFFAITATPTVKSASMTIFGDITELYGELLDSNPSGAIHGGSRTSWLFPKACLKSDHQVELFEKALNEKTGWLMHRSLKTGGIGIGVKGKGKDTRFGVGLYIADEVNRIENFDKFKADLPNASKQTYFQLHTTQNPVDEEDHGGRMCEPKSWGDWGVDSFDEVREEDMLVWPTVHSGIAYRFDGLRSVNIEFGKTIYPYLFHVHKHQQTIEDYGVESPEYKSQVRALFSGQDTVRTVLTRSKVSASKHIMKDYTILNTIGRYLGCDPAFTGLKDKAIITEGEAVNAVITHIDGSQERQELMLIKKIPIAVKNLNGFRWDTDSDFLDRFIAVGGDVNNLTLGAEISYEDQIALAMAEECIAGGIPFKHVGYDPSLRADIVSSVTKIMGWDPVAIPLSDKPIGFQLQDSRQNTEDRARNIAEECNWLGADVIASKALRGGEFVSVAINQLCSRYVLSQKPGMPIEKKIDFKERNGGRSPDHGDSYGYMCWMAYRNGFRATQVHSRNQKNGGPSLFQMQFESSSHQPRIGRRF